MPPDLLRDRDLGAILDQSLALYRAHARTLLLAALVVVVPVDLAVLGGGLGWLWSGYEGRTPVGELLLVALVQTLVVAPLVAAMAIGALRGGATGARTLVTGAAAVSGPLVATMLLVIALVVAGLLAFVVPGVIVAVHLSVVAQVVVVEGARGGPALRRSWELVRGSAWRAFAVLLVVNLLAGLLSLAITAPLDAAARAADAQAVALAGEIAVGVLTLPWMAIATTLLYGTLIARSGRGAAPVAGPVAPGVHGQPGETPALPDAPAPPDQPAPGDRWERRRAEGWRAPAGEGP